MKIVVDDISKGYCPYYGKSDSSCHFKKGKWRINCWINEDATECNFFRNLDSALKGRNASETLD